MNIKRISNDLFFVIRTELCPLCLNQVVLSVTHLDCGLSVVYECSNSSCQFSIGFDDSSVFDPQLIRP